MAAFHYIVRKTRTPKS